MSSDIPDIGLIVSELQKVLPEGGQPAVLHEPEFSAREREMLLACLDSGWVSYAGPQVHEFESRLAAICGRKYAVATVSGTAALHAALLIAGIRANDEVLIPTLTFAATANAVSYCAAIPHLVDSDSDTLGMDPEALRQHLSKIAESRADGTYNRETGRRIAAIVPVHVLGHPTRDDRLSAVAAEYDLPLIVDSTESLGSFRDERPAAAFGLLSVLSFNGNKIVTTGGGGAILTDVDGIATRLRHITTTAKKPHRWAFQHDEVGYNYRMPNLNAALGIAQLEKLDSFVSRKRRLAEAYQAACQKLPGISFVSEPADTRSNYWLNAIRLPSPDLRDGLLESLHAAGIMARPLWDLMHQLPMFADAPRSSTLAVSENLQACVVCLPSSPRLAAS
jgi:perosamine synthetase